MLQHYALPAGAVITGIVIISVYSFGLIMLASLVQRRRLRTAVPYSRSEAQQLQGEFDDDYTHDEEKAAQLFADANDGRIPKQAPVRSGARTDGGHLQTRPIIIPQDAFDGPVELGEDERRPRVPRQMQRPRPAFKAEAQGRHQGRPVRRWITQDDRERALWGGQTVAEVLAELERNSITAPQSRAMLSA